LKRISVRFKLAVVIQRHRLLLSMNRNLTPVNLTISV